MRRFDELVFFRASSEEYGIDFDWTEDSPTIDNCGLADGCDFVSVITTPVTAAMIDRFAQGGVKMIVTRTIGYDHIDLAHAKEKGMAVANISYDPEGVAEYTVMMILAAVRKLKTIMLRNTADDFSLEGQMGGVLRDMNVGVIGAGKIGSAVVRDLSGFGCNIHYYDRTGSVQADSFARKVDLDTLLEESDIVTIHLELNDETRHFLDAERIAKMKKGAIIVNTARGPLIDTAAMIDALESGHLGGAALDVVEGEFGLYYNNMRGEVIKNRGLNVLRAMPNVLLTHHMAFYYGTAIEDMICNCMRAMKLFAMGQKDRHRLV
ncbi:lactate dehydrogenase [Candidatus Methanomethylophilus sp. 1R26]|uniref:NAD(P)-dependent oxidoreductase n=1 Tax=Candidatus Methanomethylophilus sp. 1R26 TaxID=1769296 RepID=UPI000737833C|nr:NAD(P)-dependent oxidoreductase [Candidatus Methanomethylophilus sp. 1R26]KUE73373.1 lactate dehydrogenase [Candidatus Methanomethylophilus sp. 1R26]TQS79100.1 MAG: lactate dehydrogenase [Methanomethylophilus alvi]